MTGAAGSDDVAVVLGRITEELCALRAQRELSQARVVELVCWLRVRRPPVSWSSIGGALGVTGEAARQRFGRAVEREWQRVLSALEGL